LQVVNGTLQSSTTGSSYSPVVNGSTPFTIDGNSAITVNVGGTLYLGNMQQMSGTLTSQGALEIQKDAVLSTRAVAAGFKNTQTIVNISLGQANIDARNVSITTLAYTTKTANLKKSLVVLCPRILFGEGKREVRRSRKIARSPLKSGESPRSRARFALADFF
jgi:hypothetical protein